VSPAEPKIFISYRREETAGHAGRLYDAMVERFGEASIFVDVELAPGIDFVERIREAIGGCRALIVMIGPRWATLTNGGGPRLGDPDDFVRLEVETALRRPDVTVIPVLVGGAQMPDPQELPEGLRPLTRLNALELSDLRWRYDIGRLHTALDELLADARPQPGPSSPSAVRLPRTVRLVAEGMLVAGAAALVARSLADPISAAAEATDAEKIAAATLRRTVTWAALGAALAAWLSFVRGEVRLLANRLLLGLAIGALGGALGGLVENLPRYLPDPALSQETIRTISIAGFAVGGGLIGVLLGALWTPRSIAIGFLAGLVAGALARMFWNEVGWTSDSALQSGGSIGIQCLLIVALILAALAALSTQPQSPLAAEGSGAGRAATGGGRI
jgi:hypothetical protein